MDFFECQTSRQILDACNDFETQLKKLNDQKAVDDTSSMFNSIKGAAAVYGTAIGRKSAGAIWCAKNEHGEHVGLMRLKNEGAYFHLENLVGVPKAGGGAALLDLAKAIALSLEMELKLEAADEALIKYYQDRCFSVEKPGASRMVWKKDK